MRSLPIFDLVVPSDQTVLQKQSVEVVKVDKRCIESAGLALSTRHPKLPHSSFSFFLQFASGNTSPKVTLTPKLAERHNEVA